MEVVNSESFRYQISTQYGVGLRMWATWKNAILKLGIIMNKYALRSGFPNNWYISHIKMHKNLKQFMGCKEKSSNVLMWSMLFVDEYGLKTDMSEKYDGRLLYQSLQPVDGSTPK